MENAIFVKLGGSSLATAELFQKAVGLYQANNNRRFFVPSAPGAANKDEIKLTNLLIALANRYEQTHYNITAVPMHKEKEYRTDSLTELNLVQRITDKLSQSCTGNGNLAAETIQQIMTQLTAFPEDPRQHSANVQRMGEYFSAYNLAEALVETLQKKSDNKPVKILDPLEFIALNGDNPLAGEILLEKTTRNFEQWKLASYDPTAIYIMPGYYGKHDTKGTISLLDRDGTNMSFVLALIGLKPKLGENISDVPGIYRASPKLISDAKLINDITVRELYELAQNGFNVFQPDSLMMIQRSGICAPISIKNYDSAETEGTLIVNVKRNNEPVAGIGVRENVTYFTFEDPRMINMQGYIANLSRTLTDLGLNIVRSPEGEGQLTYYIDDKSFVGRLHPHDILYELSRKGYNLSRENIGRKSLITLSGEGLSDGRIKAKAFTLLADQFPTADLVGSSKVSVTYAVDREQLTPAVRIMHDYLTTLLNL